MKEKLIKIYNHFGAENQLNKLEEELLELLEVVKKIQKEGWTRENLKHFVSECADIMIVILQHILVKSSICLFLREAKFKITRTLDRMKSKFYDKI